MLSPERERERENARPMDRHIHLDEIDPSNGVTFGSTSKYRSFDKIGFGKRYRRV